MKDNSPVLCNREQLLHECEVAKLKLAFFDLLEEKTEALEINAGKDPKILNLALDNQDSALRLIRRHFRSMRLKKWGQSAHVVAKRLVKVAAIAIVATVLGVTAVFATTPSFRVTVRDLLISLTDEYAEIGVKEKQVLSVPNGWPGEYFPASIPDGFVLSQSSEGIIDVAFVEYKDASGNFLLFQEAPKGAHSNIDTQGAQVSLSTVHDHEAIVIEKENRITISWVEFEKYFVIMFDGDMQTALTIARSVRRIR